MSKKAAATQAGEKARRSHAAPVAAVEAAARRLAAALRADPPAYADVAARRDECWRLLTAGAGGFRVDPAFAPAGDAVMARLESLYAVLTRGPGWLHALPHHAAAELDRALAAGGRGARPRCRLRISGGQLLLDGRPVRMDVSAPTRDKVVTFLAHLLRQPGQFVSGGDVNRAEAQEAAGYTDERWDRVAKAVPAEVRALIESSTRGYRLIEAILA